jgi:hypothetical protein
MTVSSRSFPSTSSEPSVGAAATHTTARTVSLVSPRSRPLSKDAPLLRTEDARAYADDFRVLSKQLAPNDVVGRLLLRDFIDCDIEVRRLRTMKVALIERARRRAALTAGFGSHTGKEDTLQRAIRESEVMYRGRRVNKFDIEDVDDDEIDDVLGREDDDVSAGTNVVPAEETKKPKPRKKSKQERQVEMADAFLDCIEPYERLDQLLGRAVAMRKEALRLLEQQLDRTRKLSEEIIDAECVDVPNAGNKED